MKGTLLLFSVRVRLVQEKEIENREKHGFYSLYLSPEVNTPLIKNEYRLSVEFSIRF
jgi:hypothetical protein